MLDVHGMLLRKYLKPKVESNLPGRLRVSFPHYALLPETAKPYLHYVEDVLKLLPGVYAVQLNTRIGTILTRYDSAVTGSKQILRWVDIVVETGMEIAREMEDQPVLNEARTADLVRRRLVLRLPQSQI